MIHPFRTRKRLRRATASPEVLEDRQLLTVAFQRPFMSVSGGAGHAEIVLQRSAGYNDVATTQEQVQLATSGTAVAGVDYSALPRVVTFEPGETSKTIQVPILASGSTSGTKMLRLALAPTIDSPGGSVAFLAISHGSDATPPRLLKAKVVVKNGFVQSFVLKFSEAMAAGPVQDIRNYQLDDPKSLRTVAGSNWTLPTREIALKKAVYHQATHTVELIPKQRIKPLPMFFVLSREFGDALKMAALPTAPSASEIFKFSPITDVAGNPLDLNKDGVPDGQLAAVMTVTQRGIRS